MVNLLSRNWGWVLTRGLAVLLFGLLALVNPQITLASLVLLFAIWAIADGIFTLASAVANRHSEPQWVPLLIVGLVGIAAGAFTLLRPGITALFLLYLIAGWAIATGIFEIAAAIRLRKEITGEWLLVLGGALTVLFGVFMFARPGAGALAVVLWIGAFAIVKGVVLIGLSLRLRSWDHSHRTHQTPRMA